MNAYRQLKKGEAGMEPSFHDSEFDGDFDGIEFEFPRDVICFKKGVHFTEDFTCVSRLPGTRSTAQNYNLQCKISGKRYLCQTLPMDKSTKGCPHVENYRSLMHKIEHFALPRLVLEFESDNRLYLLSAIESDATNSDSKQPRIRSLHHWIRPHRSVF